VWKADVAGANRRIELTESMDVIFMVLLVR